MNTQTVNAAQLAARMGRSKDWIYRNWRKLVKEGMPPPLREGELVWSSVHINAWQDRNLPEDLRDLVFAFRAATEAARMRPPENLPHEKDWRADIAKNLANMQ